MLSTAIFSLLSTHAYFHFFDIYVIILQLLLDVTASYSFFT